METTIKLPFPKNVFNWIKVHVTATVLGTLIAGASLFVTIYGIHINRQEPSIETSITRALKTYQTLTIPQVPKEIIDSVPKIKNLVKTANLIEGNLNQLEALKKLIQSSKKIKTLDEAIIPVMKEKEIGDIFQKTLTVFMLTLENGDEHKLKIDELQEFLTLTTEVGTIRADVLPKLNSIKDDLDNETISKEKASKRVRETMQEYFKNPTNVKYYGSMTNLLIEFQQLTKEKLERELLLYHAEQ